MTRRIALGFVVLCGFVLSVVFQNCAKPMSVESLGGGGALERPPNEVIFQNSLGLIDVQGNNGSSIVVMAPCGYLYQEGWGPSEPEGLRLSCPVKVTFKGVGSNRDVRLVAKVNGQIIKPGLCFRNVGITNKVYTGAGSLHLPESTTQVTFELQEISEEDNYCYDGAVRNTILTVPFEIQSRPGPEFFPEIFSRKRIEAAGTTDLFVKGAVKFNNGGNEKPKGMNVVARWQNTSHVLKVFESLPEELSQFQVSKNIGGTGVLPIILTARANWDSFVVQVDDGDLTGNKTIDIFSDSRKGVIISGFNGCYANGELTSQACLLQLQPTTTTQAAATTTTQAAATTTTQAAATTTTQASATTTTVGANFGASVQFAFTSSTSCNVMLGNQYCNEYILKMNISGVGPGQFVRIDVGQNMFACRTNGLNQSQGTAQDNGLSWISLDGAQFRARVVDNCSNPTQSRALTSLLVRGACVNGQNQDGVCVDIGNE